VSDLVLDPRSTALLVMDYQPVVLDPLPDASELIKNTAAAIAAARAASATVAYVRLGFTEQDWAAVPATNTAFSAVARARYLPEDSPATAFHADVSPGPDEIAVRKTRVGPFSSTDLDAQLRARGIDTLVLTGVHTSGIVLSTVRQAADADYRLAVLSDCVSDPDPQVHEVLMTKVFPRQATVATSVRLAALFGGA
jgi:nicotinamidase-related amidase